MSTAKLGTGILGEILLGSADREGLITDRTQDHVSRLKTLRSLGWNNLSEMQKADYAGYASRGAYNYNDLNRVEAAVADLASRAGLTLTTKTDWNFWSLPTQSDMKRYLDNVASIREAFDLPEDTPNTPESMNNLTVEAANNIEKILYAAYDASDAFITGISAEYYGGDVIIEKTTLDNLTGIVVTAHYQGGGTSSVSGYTISGELVKGDNLITVTYGEYTATFTVVGRSWDSTSVAHVITHYLTNATCENYTGLVADNFNYSAWVFPEEGYTLDTLIVTLGGVDISDSVVFGHTDGGKRITLTVTDNVVIIAKATANE